MKKLLATVAGAAALLAGTVIAPASAHADTDQPRMWSRGWRAYPSTFQYPSHWVCGTTQNDLPNAVTSEQLCISRNETHRQVILVIRNRSSLPLTWAGAIVQYDDFSPSICDTSVIGPNSVSACYGEDIYLPWSKAPRLNARAGRWYAYQPAGSAPIRAVEGLNGGHITAFG